MKRFNMEQRERRYIVAPRRVVERSAQLLLTCVPRVSFFVFFARQFVASPSGFPSISALVVRMGMRVQRARARGRFAGMAE